MPTTSVSIVDFAFQPRAIQVNVGDTVTWTNNGLSPHTTTSDDGLWNSGPLTPTSTFQFRFNVPTGDYTYHCDIHPTMTGVVRVVGTSPSGVTLSLLPAVSTHNVGSPVFQITIALATGTQGVDGAETHVRFDQTRLQVTDASGVPATSITPGTTFEQTLSNRADNTTGRIDFTGATFASPMPRGNITVATITFKSLAASAPGGSNLFFNTSGAGQVTKVTSNGMVLPLVVRSAIVNIGAGAAPPGGGLPIFLAFFFDRDVVIPTQMI